MVVGIVTPAGRRVISYGRMSQGDARRPDTDTVFEIGSVTKVFTSLLLADMVERGEVALGDPVARYLPQGVRVPERNGRRITLLDLATHTSGLPFAPSDLDARDPKSYASYTERRLYQFLSAYALRSDIGSAWDYSNLGTSLLATALSRRAGTSYEALVRSRITRPLGMRSTAVTVTPAMRKRLAAGHDAQLRPAPPWDSPALPGEGDLKSSVHDLLTFLSAFLGEKRSPLAPAMAAMLRTRRHGRNLEQALGWWVIPFGPGDEGIITHGGQTWGYSCTLAYDPKAHVGVVVLSNSPAGDGGLAWHLLRPAWPVEMSEATKAREGRKEVAVDPALFDNYTGRYRPEGGEAVTIERRGDELFFKSPLTPPEGVRLRPLSGRVFFVREADLTVTFQADEKGKANRMVIRFAGKDYPAARVGDRQEDRD